MTSPRLDAGSFRDRDGRVFFSDGRVFRALSASALETWDAVEKSAFFPALVEGGKIVASRRSTEGAALAAGLGGDWAGCLEHDRIPLVAYPYEWSFAMLRDAALLQLELVERGLKEGFASKDATPFNFLFRGCRPVFIDVASFERWKPGDPWVGYGQFCRLFLFPLLLAAYRDLPFQRLLRGSLEGIEVRDCSRILSSWRDRLRPGVFRDVYLQAALQTRTEGSDVSLRSELRSAGFAKELILANVRRLKKIVAGLRWDRARSEWSDYAEDNSYDDAGRQAKERFVEGVVEGLRPQIVWDVGANTGHYSRLAARHAAWVVSMDGDPLAVDRHYRRLREKGPENVLPMVVDLADPSPGLGWRHRERKPLDERQRPDVVLALALLHHLVITANVPLPEVLDWLRSLDAVLVVELVGEDDPQVHRLMRNKGGAAHEYGRAAFERELARRFRTTASQEVLAGKRWLYRAEPA